MARKQFLINYHTSDVQNMPSQENLRLGEIAVRHADAKPELIIKLDSGEFATFADGQTVSGMVHTVNTGLAGRIDAAEGQIGDIKTTIQNNQSALTQNFPTKNDVANTVSNAIASAQTFADTAKADAIASGKTYTDGQVGEVNTRVDTVAGNVNTVSASVNTLRTDLERDYTTKVYTNGEVVKAIASAQTFADTAKDDAIASGKTYTDGQVGEVNTRVDTVAGNVNTVSASVNTLRADLERDYATNVYTNGEVVKAIASAQTFADTAKVDAIAAASAYTDGKIATVDARVDTVVGNISTLSGAIETLEDELTDAINAKVASAYIYKGSCAYADLPKGYGEDEIGFVWNVTDANGNFPAGTNYAWTGTEWDALGGSIDLSPYALSADVKTQIDGVNDRIDEVAGDVEELSGVVMTNYATKVYTNGEVVKAIASAQTFADTAKADAIASGKSYTDDQVGKVNTRVDGVAGNVNDLSGVVKTFKADVENNYATKVYANGEVVKAIASAQTFADTAKDSAIASGKSYTDGKINTVEFLIATVDGRVDTVVGNVNELSGVVKTFKADVEGNYATKVYANGEVVKAIASAQTFADTAKADAIAAASAYTVQQIGLVEDKIDVIEGKFPTLDSAIQSITVNSGVLASKSGTTVALDFTKMVIDGGEF